MPTLKKISAPYGDEYYKIDFSSDLATTGNKSSPYMYYPAGHWISVTLQNDNLSGTNTFSLWGTIDPNSDGSGAGLTSNFNLTQKDWLFNPVNDQFISGTATSGQTTWVSMGYPYIRVNINMDTANPGDTLIVCVRFFKL